MALGVIGLILWCILNIGGNFDFYLLNYGILILAVLWIYNITRSHKLYISTLATAIRNRFISGSEIAMESASFIKLLKDSIYNHQKEDKGFACI